MQSFRISWDEGLVRHFHTGVDRGMFYIPEQAGIPWNGLREVVESSPDSVMTQLYQDGQKLTVRRRDLNYDAQVKALTYPVEFEPYSGDSPVFNKPFGFSYRVMTGEKTYRIHLVYNVVAIPDDVVFSSISDEIDPVDLSWKFTTRPVKLSGLFPSSHIIIDSEMIHSWTLDAIEDTLYGGEGVIPHLPSPNELDQILQDNALFKVFDNGNGTYTVVGPDEAIQDLGSGLIKLDWPSVVPLPDGISYNVSSL